MRNIPTVTLEPATARTFSPTISENHLFCFHIDKGERLTKVSSGRKGSLQARTFEALLKLCANPKVLCVLNPALLKPVVRGVFTSEKNIMKGARFHHVTVGMRLAEFILKETEGLTRTLRFAQDFARPRNFVCADYLSAIQG